MIEQILTGHQVHVLTRVLITVAFFLGVVLAMNYLTKRHLRKGYKKLAGKKRLQIFNQRGWHSKTGKRNGKR